MKALIELDVPDWQIGAPVTVYFPDTMCKKGICVQNNNEPAAPEIATDAVGIRFNCGHCGRTLWLQKDTASLEYNKHEFLFCHYCGRPVKTNG